MLTRFPSPLAHQQRGLSLVELMVGMVIGLVILAAAGTMYISSARTGRDTLISAQLNTTLRGAMEVMADEIRRAGYSLAGGRNSAFMSRGAGTFSDLNVSADGTCVEFSYDSDNDGTLDNAEYSGFRVQGLAVQMRNGGAGVVANCANGNWEAITDPNSVRIVNHTNGQNFFVVTYQCMNAATGNSDNNACIAGGSVFDAAVAGGTTVDLIETRTITINMGAQVADDNAMRMQSVQRVLVRNHRVVTAG